MPLFQNEICIREQAALNIIKIYAKADQYGRLPKQENYMFSKIISGSIQGISCVLTQVEVDIAKSMPAFDMVGMLSGEVKEARERVRVALKNAGIPLPPLHITVNLSPANIRKEGTAYDLPIAIGILTALGHIPEEYVQGICMVGELGLNGEVKPIKGVLPIVREAAAHKMKACIIPMENQKEGAVIEGISVIGVGNFQEAVEYFQAPWDGERLSAYREKQTEDIHRIFSAPLQDREDFADVAGQEVCKRAALIAAAGFHHMLISGPPGTGKTMIARRMPGILPKLTVEESLEVSSIYSVSGLLNKEQYLITSRPFLAPHHTTTAATLAGGGSIPRPGLFSLCHRGVLFLDELPEFNRECIEVMRQPLEEKKIQISRTQGTYTYPADFMLVAAANPCPCGYYPDRSRCRCSAQEIKRYRNKISGPIRDRIDLHVMAQEVDIGQLNNPRSSISSEELRKKVMLARKRQEERFRGTSLHFNSDISSREIPKYCYLGAEECAYMEKMFHMLNLSARSYHKILKTARTIADIEEAEQISIQHLAEAAAFRVQEETEDVP